VYVWRFLLLWVAGKAANAVTAGTLHLPPLGFRPATELAACAAEVFVLWAFIRRGNEDVLLGNLGVDRRTALGPLALLHFGLSAALALAT
jgi:hypothetical protein